MKISKFILACVLSGIVGNVFAAPTKLYCQYNGASSGFEIEFDDNNRSRIYVDGETIPRNEMRGSLEIKYEVDEISSYNIMWSRVAIPSIGSDFRSLTIYSINRNTGEIELDKTASTGDLKRIGKCEKLENVVKKF